MPETEPPPQTSSRTARAVPAHTAVIPLPGAARWRAFWVCVSVAAITILDMTKVNVALPSIGEVLDAGSTELQLIVSGFVLTFGLVLVPMGRLGNLAELDGPLLLLTSDAGAFMTGSVITVDGGHLLAMG